MLPHDCARVDAILLDIEGTTTPVDYVFGVLFPFAKDHVMPFLASQGQGREVQADLELLRQEYAEDMAHGLVLPPWEGTEPTAAVPYIYHLIDIDRKSTGLKSLQGRIWDQGYREGTLRSQVFADVKPAFERWTTSGQKKLFIFSSGSIHAQQLLFRHTEVGDLTGYLSGFFDTRIGSKKVAESYVKIAGEIGLPTARILFISDVTAELRAAQSTAMQTLFSQRPGNKEQEAKGFAVIETFDPV